MNMKVSFLYLHFLCREKCSNSLAFKKEWGNPNEKDYFDYMLSYSPYDNIPKGKQFPDMLIKAGLFDPRVAYWEVFLSI